MSFMNFCMTLFVRTQNCSGIFLFFFHFSFVFGILQFALHWKIYNALFARWPSPRQVRWRREPLNGRRRIDSGFGCGARIHSCSNVLYKRTHITDIVKTLLGANEACIQFLGSTSIAHFPFYRMHKCGRGGPGAELRMLGRHKNTHWDDVVGRRTPQTEWDR